MQPTKLGTTMREVLRRLHRLEHLRYVQQRPDGRQEFRAGERLVLVDLTTGAWEGGTEKGCGIFSLGRHLGIDPAIVNDAWTKALAAR